MSGDTELSDELEPLFLRVPADVKRALRERAKAHCRSMNAQALVELQQLQQESETRSLIS